MAARSPRGLLDFVAAALCLWAGLYHTPLGALGRSALGAVTGGRANVLPLLSYYRGGAPGDSAPASGNVVGLAAAPPAEALGLGAFRVAMESADAERAPLHALGQAFHFAPEDPASTAALLEAAKRELGSDDAAVLAAFLDLDVVRYAVRRAAAEGRAPTLPALAAQLPPSADAAVARAGRALTLALAYSLAWPVDPGTRVASPFGWRRHPTLGTQKLHTGVDLAVPVGTPVTAVAAGVVRRAGEDDVNGRFLIVDHGQGVSTAYCHNSRLLVVTGQRVQPGDVISESGNTGRSTGPHLHFQLTLGRTPVDPLAYRPRAVP